MTKVGRRIAVGLWKCIGIGCRIGTTTDCRGLIIGFITVITRGGILITVGGILITGGGTLTIGRGITTKGRRTIIRGFCLTISGRGVRITGLGLIKTGGRATTIFCGPTNTFGFR